MSNSLNVSKNFIVGNNPEEVTNPLGSLPMPNAFPYRRQPTSNGIDRETIGRRHCERAESIVPT